MEDNRSLTPEQLLRKLKSIIIDLHKALGPGLLESAYKNALYTYLIKHGFDVKIEHPVDIVFEDIRIPKAYYIDMLVNDCVIIELKSVSEITLVHHRQLRTYMHLANMPFGILANFNCYNMFRDGLRSWKYEDTAKPLGFPQ